MVFEIMEKLIERFLEYIAIDTMSDPKSDTVPSSSIQLPLAKKLKEELEEIGLKATLDDKGYVYATLEANTDKKVPVIGFIAHIDTSPALTGGCKNPKFTEYKGGDIKLNEQYSITEAEFPILKKLVGKTIITTDGTTLLGADDKAGVAEIMNALEYLVKHPEIKHGDIKMAFGPDEEIGRGADYFDVKEFAADYAYTMDGGPIGELEYESFNAAQATFKIKGVSVHPGTAKGKMINAGLIASEIIEMFPKDEVPEKTEGYEGFYYLVETHTACEDGEVVYILRDHDKAKFLAKKEFVKELVEKVNKKYGREVVKLELKDEYYNMGEIIKDHMYVVDIAKQAMENLGIKPLIKAIRGGTDGSKISFMGLPTPNIFAGGENFHGKYEFVALESMEKATDVIVEIVKLNAER